MDTEVTKTLPQWSISYVLLGLWFGLLVGLVTCLCCFVIGTIYWTSMALLAIASAIRSSWKRFDNFGYGWSKRQKTPLPRSAWMGVKNA